MKLIRRKDDTRSGLLLAVLSSETIVLVNILGLLYHLLATQYTSLTQLPREKREQHEPRDNLSTHHHK